jgi:protease-4
VVRVASPGGTVAGSEALFETLRDVAEEKPVVAVIGEVAASGGYLAAMGADRIFARQNSITGSIGVISQVPNVTELLDRLGISYRAVKSAPLKAEPDPFTEPSEEAFDAVEQIVMESYRWFSGVVSERRGLEGPALETVTDGRVFTGGQARELGLVDQIGDIEDARAWLEEERGVSRELPLREVRWGEPDLPFPFDRMEETVSAYLPPPPLSVAPGPRLLALYTE